MALEQMLGVVRVDPSENWFGVDVSIEPVCELHGDIGFGIAFVAFPEHGLAMKVG